MKGKGKAYSISGKAVRRRTSLPLHPSALTRFSFPPWQGRLLRPGGRQPAITESRPISPPLWDRSRKHADFVGNSTLRGLGPTSSQSVFCAPSGISASGPTNRPNCLQLVLGLLDDFRQGQEALIPRCRCLPNKEIGKRHALRIHPCFMRLVARPEYVARDFQTGVPLLFTDRALDIHMYVSSSGPSCKPSP